jgi:hypothetical protein
MNVPFSVPRSTASNYLVSDPSGNAMGAEFTDIHGSDSASSFSASSSIGWWGGVDNIPATKFVG